MASTELDTTHRLKDSFRATTRFGGTHWVRGAHRHAARAGFAMWQLCSAFRSTGFGRSRAGGSPSSGSTSPGVIFDSAIKEWPEHIAEMKAEYYKVAPTFVKNQKGHLHSSWRKGVSLKTMADEAQLGELYPIFYSVASSIQHVDISGMGHQVADGMFDVAVTPNEKFVKEAAIVGQHMTLRVLHEFNAAGNLGFDEQIEAAGKNHVAAWKKGQA